MKKADKLKRRNFSLTLILMLLLLAAYLFIKVNRAKYNAKKVSGTILTKGKESIINKITINNKEELIVLEKLKDKWYLTAPEEYPANQDKVNNMFLTLTSGIIEDLITDDKKLYSRIGADKENGIQVSLYENEKEIANYIIGQDNFSLFKGYIRLADKVYMVDRLLEPAFDITLGNIKDKRLLHFDKSKIVSINLTSEKVKMKLIKDKNDWINSKSKDKVAKAEEFLTLLNDSKMANFAMAKVRKNFSKSYFKVELIDSSNAKYELILVKLETNYLAKSNWLGRTVLSEVAEDTAKKLYDFRF